MTPGSQGAGAVLACFSGEDSGQKGEAIGKPRVARRSWSRHLSNAPRPAGQIAASRKDSAREGGRPGEKCVKSSVHFSSLFVCVCACICSSSRSRFSTFLVPSESLCYPFR
jgi:hypothetical protein